MTLPPIDTPEQRAALARANRRVLAERLLWPAGHLEACEQVDAEHPYWHATWSRANPGPAGFEHPARFTAFWRRPGDGRAPDRFRHAAGETIAELLADMAALEGYVQSGRLLGA